MKIEKLPDAEFEIMQIIWNAPTPITTAQVAERVKGVKDWHLSTVKTLLRRLAARGYLTGEKHGQELYYTSLVTQDEYIQAETELFMEKIHKKSLRGFIRAMYAEAKPSKEDLAEIEKLLQDKE